MKRAYTGVVRSTFWSRLALALLSVVGVFVPLVETSTFDEVTIDGTRREKPRDAPRTQLSVVPRPETERRTEVAPAAPELATPKRFLLHRAWLN